MSAPEPEPVICAECGQPWGVVAPTAPLYPMGVIGHYCAGRRVTREPTTLPEVALVLASERASREGAERLKVENARRRQEDDQHRAAKMLEQIEPELDAMIERLATAEGLLPVDRRWAVFALGGLWAELKQTARGR